MDPNFWMVVEIFNFTTLKSTCLCLTQRNLKWFHKKHPSVPQAVFIDLYYTLTDFWLNAQIKKDDVKNCTKNQFTCCSNLHAGICCYVRQHITRRTVASNLNLLVCLINIHAAPPMHRNYFMKNTWFDNCCCFLPVLVFCLYSSRPLWFGNLTQWQCQLSCKCFWLLRTFLHASLLVSTVIAPMLERYWCCKL